MKFQQIGPSLTVVLIDLIFLQNVLCVLDLQISNPSMTVCKGTDVDMNWFHYSSDPVKATQWLKKSIPTDLLLMTYLNAQDKLIPTGDYTDRALRTSSNAGIRLTGSHKGDHGDYFVRLTVDFGDGDPNNYVHEFTEKSVSLEVLEGVNHGIEPAILSLDLGSDNETLVCSGPSTLGDATLAIMGPKGEELVSSTTNTTLEVYVGAKPNAGEYLCRAYFPTVEFQDTVIGHCLPPAVSYIQYIPAKNQTGRKGGPNVGLAVGLTFFFVAIAAGVVIALFFVYRRLKHKQYQKNTHVEIVHSNSPKKQTLEISKPLRAEEFGIEVRKSDAPTPPPVAV